MNISQVRTLLASGQISVRHTVHARTESRKDGLTDDDLQHAIQFGEVIEDYGDRALLLDFTVADNIPCHVAIEYVTGGTEVVTVSAYVPDGDLWEKDWKTRRKPKRGKRR